MKLRDAFTSPEHKQRYVRTLFDTIAPRYDFITVVLSFGRDRAWKRFLIESARLAPGERVLDLACGTGDLSFAAARTGARVIGLDVTAKMLRIARAKGAASACPLAAHFVVGDMMTLPFASGAADVITTGYGLRNVPRLEPAIAEIARVLKPGGRFLSLDFNRPDSTIVRELYFGYLTVVGSALGWALHRDPDTYRYIAESLRRYPSREGVAVMLRRAGFATVRAVPILFGFLMLHICERGEVRD